jgi:L-glyceraldehyde 3-phosphate reductase
LRRLTVDSQKAPLSLTVNCQRQSDAYSKHALGSREAVILPDPSPSSSRNEQDPLMYLANSQRYEQMTYTRCGRSGLQLPKISLGLWQNFGGTTSYENAREMVLKSFDRGITHFDLANNYGPPPGSAEENFGRIVRADLASHRDELIVSTKAGYLMWPGPYGEWGSRKYLLSSLDQSLERMGLDYVDIFYSHRVDPATPLEETMGALDTAVRSGRALYVGISSYGPKRTREAAAILRDLKTPFIIHQPSYSMLNRWVEQGLLDVLKDEGIGSIAFSPLAQGLLTAKYLKGIPESSRAALSGSFGRHMLSEQNLNNVRALNEIAQRRGQTLAQMAIAWVLRQPAVTSALIGASRWSQIEECLGALKASPFAAEELASIDRHASDGGLNIWAASSQSE